MPTADVYGAVSVVKSSTSVPLRPDKPVILTVNVNYNIYTHEKLWST